MLFIIIIMFTIIVHIIVIIIIIIILMIIIIIIIMIITTRLAGPRRSRFPAARIQTAGPKHYAPSSWSPSADLCL